MDQSTRDALVANRWDYISNLNTGVYTVFTNIMDEEYAFTAKEQDIAKTVQELAREFRVEDYVAKETRRSMIIPDERNIRQTGEEISRRLLGLADSLKQTKETAVYDVTFRVNEEITIRVQAGSQEEAKKKAFEKWTDAGKKMSVEGISRTTHVYTHLVR